MKKEQFERARANSDHGVLVHLVCNEADHLFYSDDPDALSVPQKTVLCVETFFGAVCEGGFVAWFDLDHGQLAHCGAESLRRVGLTEYAKLADYALQLHHQDPLPTTCSAWGQHLERIRSQHEEEDCSEIYAPLDAEFFALYHRHPCEFRERLFAYIVEHEEELLNSATARV